MDIPLRKVTARVDFKTRDPFTLPQPRSRPGSPTRQSPTSSLSPPPVHPRAKVNSNATLRKPSSSSPLSASRSNDVSAPIHSRPGSPLKPSRMLPNASELSRSPKARISVRPTSRSRMSPVQANLGSLEPRQRALTAASARLKLPHAEERPRSGSVVQLHHAYSVSDLNISPSPTLPRPLSPVEPPLVNTRQAITPPVLAPIKIKSKVTDFIKSTPTSTGDSGLRPLSPSNVTRQIRTRSRAPSITSFSLNNPPLSAFYPITTASPAANPYRYVPRRAPSPAHSHPSPALSSELHSAKKSSLVPKVDPALVPLPPHSPPISALSLSSKSSNSKTTISLNSEQSVDNQISSIVSHVKHRSIERTDQVNRFCPPAEIEALTKRDRSHSQERSPYDLVHRGESDSESEGSERQLRVEAKTNRKIADLEITNRSLLVINGSLETTKNRQAKEIRDLRRKLRESRLILPPQTYRAVASALDDDDDDSDAEEADETFQRVRSLIDNLIESGKRALETRPEDFGASLTTKVLNADELRSWRDSGQCTSMRNNFMDRQDADDETIQNHISPVIVGIPDNGSTSSVESDDELASDSQGSSTLPPITITRPL